jgi:transcriptional regulator with GAF, ATPase, and Fis domain
VTAGHVELLVGVELEDTAIPASVHNQFGLAVGTSLPMRRIFGVLERMSPTPASVLLIGETGTGKDVLARSIHMNSARADGPFEVVDCGAVAPTLIESELFGHERGAFTGAVSARTGAFERAAGGTLFLDEIGELALDLQPKLLRVLESREFRRVGGTRTLPADVRVVAATTRDLAGLVAAGEFRDDLYFRLAVVTLHIPALRERMEDLPVVAGALLRACDPDPPILRHDVLAALKSYDWPGNVREVRNVLERGLYAARAIGQNEVKLVGFPPQDRGSPPSDGATPVGFRESESYRETRARFQEWFEKRYVEWLLTRHGGSIRAAARAARMDRNHLSDLAHKHGIVAANSRASR